MRTVYLDNAATTWPKPKEIMAAVSKTMKRAGGNPGRGSHPLAAEAAKILVDCREEAAALFDTGPDRVVITSGATAALNTAIFGLVRPGSHVLYDNYCHNAVRRPLHALQQRGICRAELYDARGGTAEILAELESRLRPETVMVIATHQSNICPKILPLREIGAFCRKRGLIFVADAAQSAGHLPISVKKDNISALCIPGHKGLYGPMGAGLLILGDGTMPDPILFGGAGIRSLDEDMPEDLPERLEAGTLPVPAAAGLAEGMRWVRRQGLDAIRRREESLSGLFCEALEKIPGFTLCGGSGGSVVSFLHRSATPAKIGTILGKHGICVRTGFHCAPEAHRTIGSGENGTVRVSFSCRNREEDVERILNVLRRFV